MQTDSKTSFKMKVFPKGQVVIPIALRKKYKIDIGDQLDIVPSPDGILLKPVPKEEAAKSLTDKLFGIFSDYAKGKPEPSKKEIKKATEAGFTEGWVK